MFLITLIIICVILLLLYYKKRNSDYWKKRGIVQEDGVIWKFIFGNRSIAEVYKDVYDKHPTEPHVGMFIGSKPALLLRDLDNVHAVLSGDFQSFYSRGIPIAPNDKLADNVLFIDEFARWKLIRQKISPVFTRLKLKNMFYIMERCARDFAETVKSDPKITEKPFNALYHYTTASIGASVFGIDTHTKNTMDSPFLDMAWKSVTPSLRANFSLFIGNTFPQLFKILDCRAFSQFEEFFIGAVQRVLNMRRSEKDKRHDFIDICLELQEQGTMKDAMTGYELEPTDELLAAQAFFFFVAGADTSANTMHFTLLELSNNPDILKKVQDEIDRVFNECNENVTYNDIEKLNYLDMVLNEAMRKYPPIGLMQRKCTKDTVLPVGNVNIEKNTLVVVPVYAIHRDERNYPNPELFLPERFSAENVLKIQKFSNLSFGEGNRVCLGMRFARLQVKAGLSWLLRRFTLREQNCQPDRFETSVFSLRASHVRYDIVPRNV